MIDILPGIQETVWQDVERNIRLVARHVQWVHIDIMDGTLVPGQTHTDFSPLAAIAGEFPYLSFEAHLMVINPEKYIRQLSDWGFKRVSSHVESNDPRRFLEAVKFEDMEVGLALDGPTELEEIEPFLEEIDYAVVMTSEAGAVKQPFLPEAVEKIKKIRQNFPDLPIEAVGGITAESASLVVEAGASRVVVNRSLFADPDRIAQVLRALRGA